MFHCLNFLYCSQRNNYQILLTLALDKKLKSQDRNENWVGLLLVQLIAKTNSFFSFFFFFFFWRKNISSLVEILSLAYYLVWSMVHAYIPYRSIRRGDCSLICIKLGSITPCSFRIRLLIWYTLCTHNTASRLVVILLLFFKPLVSFHFHLTQWIKVFFIVFQVWWILIRVLLLRLEFRPFWS